MDQEPGTSRWHKVRFVLTILLLVLASAAAFVGGCIRRYPVPVEPPEAKMPYSAIATWRGIELPAPLEGAAPLPAGALRLAVGPSIDDVFADTALVDGREAARTADGWDECVALVGEAGGPIVLIAHAELLDPGLCARLEPLSPRLVVATGVSGYADEGGDLREPVDGISRDPLAGGSFVQVCPPSTI